VNIEQTNKGANEERVSEESANEKGTKKGVNEGECYLILI
jgi:hypothetical protein